MMKSTPCPESDVSATKAIPGKREAKAARKQTARKQLPKNARTKRPRKTKRARSVKNATATATSPSDMMGRTGGRAQTARGKWTAEEHNRFLKALHDHGNKWCLVEQDVQTRTRPQIRSHCQKYFEGIKRRALEELKATNQLHNKFFLITREYINTNSIFLRRPFEIDLEPGQYVRSTPRHPSTLSLNPNPNPNPNSITFINTSLNTTPADRD